MMSACGITLKTDIRYCTPRVSVLAPGMRRTKQSGLGGCGKDWKRSTCTPSRVRRAASLSACTLIPPIGGGKGAQTQTTGFELNGAIVPLQAAFHGSPVTADCLWTFGAEPSETAVAGVCSKAVACCSRVASAAMNITSQNDFEQTPATAVSLGSAPNVQRQSAV